MLSPLSPTLECVTGPHLPDLASVAEPTPTGHRSILAELPFLPLASQLSSVQSASSTADTPVLRLHGLLGFLLLS